MRAGSGRVGPRRIECEHGTGQKMNKSSTPTFIPSAEQLSDLERDLRFHPVTTERPTTLTPEQIAAFNRDGYLAGIRIFDDAEISEIRRYFDELLAKTLAAGGDSYSISRRTFGMAAFMIS